jgi:predicted transposase YbfD/YdcC
VLGQREVDDKSNEITAIPALLEMLSLANSIMTPWVARRRSPPGSWSDYLLVLKANHGKAFLAIEQCCERHCFARGATAKPGFDAFDDSHDRLVRRCVFVCPQAASLEVLRTVLAVETIRGVNGSGKVEAEIRYFLSSCRDDPTGLVQAIRRHWTIQNGPYWILDVTFREDDSRVRNRTAARNLAFCARSPSTSWAGTEHPGSACGRRASRPPGKMIIPMPGSSDLSLITDNVGKGRFSMPCHWSELIGSGITCSLSWLDDFMRCPWVAGQGRTQSSVADQIRSQPGAAISQTGER